MRIEYKTSIVEHLIEAINTTYRDIECIYLTEPEWRELHREVEKIHPLFDCPEEEDELPRVTRFCGVEIRKEIKDENSIEQ